MAKRQILVVEDERIVAAGIKNELETFGYSVSGVASNAADAIKNAIRDKPDLILMDIHLNGTVDGIEAARQIHEGCSTPVVYLSAFADPPTVARAAETQAYGYLLKPYEEWELFTTIEIALAKHTAEQQLANSFREASEKTTSLGPSAIGMPTIRGRKSGILLAEADPNSRDFARQFLEGRGYQVYLAANGIEALEVFRQSREQIGLAVIDLNIPRLAADSVITQLVQIAPDIQVVLSSNYFAEDHCDCDSRLRGVITKPYSQHELERVIHLIPTGIGNDSHERTPADV